VGVYDISNPDDRLRLALDQPNRWRRQAVVNMVRRRYGELAAQAVVEGLHRVAKERAA
jgi:hypothetical protein